MQISISNAIGRAISLGSYASKLIKAFKARVLSYPTSIFEAEACLSASLKELNTIGLLDNASLVITPNAYKESVLYSVVPNTTLGDMDVVRATTATRVNEQGLVEVVPYNLLGYSQEFENAYWAKTGVTITPDVIVAPNGTLTGDAFVLSLTTSLHKIRKDFSFVAGNNYTASIYAKKGSQDFIQIKMSFSAFGGAWRIATFNLNTGVVVSHNSNSGILPTITNVGNGWYRCTFTCLSTASISDEYSYQISDFNFTGDGSIGFYIWGSQLVINTIPQTYFPTTTRLNIPRIDYTNGSCPSILVEPQRTNLMIYSEQFENSIWAKSNISITANTVLSPSGIVNADTLTTSNPPSESFIRYSNFSITANVGSSYTTTVFAKKGTGNFLIIRNLFVQNGATSGKAWFNLNTGVIGTVESSQTASMQNMGDGWYRCTLTGIVGSLSNFNFIDFGLTDTNGSSSSSVSVNGYVWGAQLEQGSNATSYIPTIASTVTRNADVISKTGISSLIGQTEGTVFFDLNTIKFKPDFNSIMFSDGTDGFRFGITSDSNFTQLQCIYVSTQTFSSNVLALPINTKIKIAIKYSIGELKFFANGVLISSFSPTNDFSVNNLSQFRTGRPAGGREFFGEISSILLWKTKLTDAECIALTTL